ncbi:MAG: 3-hydroxyacyl-CoA dehydrogenase NAD-binding domain-containing protein, partial [Tumebacillaceae bacterium]
MDIRKVLVVGAGQMGGGIAQVIATAGIEVILNDIKAEFLERGIGVIAKNLSRDVEKGRKTEEEKAAILARIKPTTNLGDAHDCQLAIEAATENMEIKKNIFRSIDEVIAPGAILATNTSSLPITEIAAVTSRPELVIGMHFMNPVPVMKLVEIIRGLATTDEVYKAIEELTKQLGKVPVEVNDFPGFVSNRILM